MKHQLNYQVILKTLTVCAKKSLNPEFTVGWGSATLTIKRTNLPLFLAIKLCVELQNIFEPHNEGTLR